MTVTLCCRLLSSPIAWREVFSLYAYSLGSLLILRSITVSIVWDAVPTEPALEAAICIVFLFLLSAMLLSARNDWLMLTVPIIVFTVISGYVVGMFESAIKEPGPKIGFFEPVVVISRSWIASDPEQRRLEVGVNHGQLALSDPFNRETGTYEDTWTLSDSVGKGDTVEVMVASRQFDTYVRIEADGQEICRNDDDPRGSTLDSRAVAVLPAADQYTVIVTSFGRYETGQYLLDFDDDAATPRETLADCPAQ